MSTALTTTEDEPTDEKPIALHSLQVGKRGIECRTVEDLYRFGQLIWRTGMQPASFDSPEKIMVAIQYGAEVGLAPMQSLASVMVVNGRPAMWGDALKALVEASPHCEYIKETIDGALMIATCEAKRVGRPEPHIVQFTKQDAQDAGLWDKPIWKKYPKRMLQMRARAFALRDTFPDVLAGMSFREELDDIDPAPAPLESGDTHSGSALDTLCETLPEAASLDVGADTEGAIRKAWRDQGADTEISSEPKLEAEPQEIAEQDTHDKQPTITGLPDNPQAEGYD